MVTLKNKPRTLETPVNPKQPTNHEQSQPITSEQVSGYEQCRDKRIRENMERMQKLGLFNLSSKLNSEIHSPKRSPRKGTFERRTPRPSPLQSSAPARRSSRLQDSTPISYSELNQVVKGKRERRVSRKSRSGPLIGQGLRPEVYTEEHEKLLGSCEQGSWTLFVDGCGVDGRRVYDSFKGKTCHQCRQKTLGHRTQCSSCEGVQGQFCGDCLYMRYGEHVLEANQNPNWICPVCRDICNCSLCRRAKGWPATGALYRTISNLGFKSVAHYLIQTKRAETKSGDVVTEDPVPVKKSLPFTDTEEVQQNDTLNSDDRQHGKSKDGLVDKKDNELGENKELSSAVTEKISVDTDEGNVITENKETGNLESIHDVRNVKEDESKGDKKESLSERSINIVVSASKVTQDGISSRLRSRRNKLDPHCIIQTPSKETKSDESKVEKEEPSLSEQCLSKAASGRKRKSGAAYEPNPDNLDPHCIIQTPSKETKSDESKVEKEEPSLSEQGLGKAASGRKRKSGAAYEPNPDSISGRLRQRRNRSCGA